MALELMPMAGRLRSSRFIALWTATARSYSTRASSTTQMRPPWLEKIENDHASPPKLYSWTSANLPKSATSGYAPNKRSGRGNPDERIHIIGLGNLGRLIATSLAQLQEPPPITLVLHRESLLEHWAKDPGIEITRTGVTTRFVDFDVEMWTEERPSRGPVTEVCNGQRISNLIVTTKAPQALPQVDKLRRYLDGGSTVAFVQNGMSKLWPPYGAQYCRARFQDSNHPNFLVCVTMQGAYSLGNFKSVHAALADTVMGYVLLNDKTSNLADYLRDQILAAPHLNTRMVSSSRLWVLQVEKLIVNCIVNPLTAILRCNNGGLFLKTDGPIAEVINILLKEAVQVVQSVIRAESIRELFPGQNHLKNAEGDTQIDQTRQELLERFSFPNMRAMLYSVGEKVKDNNSSMLQDVTQGKSTEIREFNGWLVDTAELFSGLEVDNHKKVIQLVEDSAVLDEYQLRRLFPPRHDSDSA